MYNTHSNLEKTSRITGIVSTTMFDLSVSTPYIQDHTITLGTFNVPPVPIYVKAAQSIPSVNQIFLSTNNALLLKSNTQLRYSLYNQNDSNADRNRKYLEKTAGNKYQIHAINSKGMPIALTINENGEIFVQMEEHQQPGVYIANIFIDIIIE